MKWYKAEFKLKSWYASAWHADTFFGHLCWAMRYLEGDSGLKKFLDLYQDGNPPFLVSNGFPSGFLPQPIFPPGGPTKNREHFREQKKVRKRKFITLSEFNQVIGGENAVLVSSKEPREAVNIALKNQINRLTCTTDTEHPLYNFEERYYPEITFYFKMKDDSVDLARRLVRYVAMMGYGKRKSAGYGQIEHYSFEPFEGFNLPQNSNGFVTLSNFVPSATDPTEGFWSLMVKYGKLGEEYATSDNVFKKPLLMIEAGSTFYAKTPRDYYGCIVKNISPRYEHVVHYAFALPVPICLPVPNEV